MGTEEYNRLAEWTNNKEKELQELKEGPEIDIYQESLIILIKVPNWKTPGYVSMHRFWFRIFSSIYDSSAD